MTSDHDHRDHRDPPHPDPLPADDATQAPTSPGLPSDRSTHEGDGRPNPPGEGHDDARHPLDRRAAGRPPGDRRRPADEAAETRVATPDRGAQQPGPVASGPDLDPRWVEAMRRHGGTRVDDATWQAIVDRAEDPTAHDAGLGARRRTATRLGWAAAVAVVALVVGAAAVIATGDGDDGEQVQAGPTADTWDEPAAEWERLPDPPLSPRDAALTAWTGEELLVFGGTTWTCPPGADCVGPEPDQLLTDGAALDPETGEWRSIAPIPTSDLGGTAATVGDDVYVLRHLAYSGIDGGDDELSLVRYSIPDDEWSDVALPEGAASGWYTAQAAGDRLVLVPGSDEAGVHPLLSLDPSTGTWTEMPSAPLPLMFDRSAVWSAPYLYVFGKELVPNPGSEEPSLTIGARVELDTMKWAPLPDSEILGNPYVASDGLLVSPQPGGADGGDVNAWGRTYPYGGIFDTATQTWRELPEAPGGDDAGMTAGVIGSTTAWFDGGGGDLFDTTTEGWTTMPALDETPAATTREIWGGEVHTAGMDAVVVGGVDWSDDEPELLGDAWIWRSGRSGSASSAEGDGETASTEGTNTCGSVDEEGVGDEPCPPDDPATPSDEVEYFVAATVLDDGDGPELCLGGVATSLPPQCGGPPIEGWDWDAVDGEEPVNGTTWGDFEVVGTYDGTTFTLTRAPAPVDPSDDPDLLDAPPDLDPDFTAPCPEPEGGWPIADPAVWGIDQLNAFMDAARSVDGFAGLWVDGSQAGGQGGGGAGGVYVVAVAGGPEVEAAADDALRDLWGGAICVTSAERTYEEVAQARDEATALAQAAGETVLSSSVSEVDNEAYLQVIAPAPELQAQLDERLGEGTVIAFSALRRLA